MRGTKSTVRKIRGQNYTSRGHIRRKGKMDKSGKRCRLPTEGGGSPKRVQSMTGAFLGEQEERAKQKGAR